MDVRKLHYGDLYSGVPAFQVLTITNVSKEVLEVMLSTDAQGEVSFDTDHPDPVEDDTTSQKEIGLRQSVDGTYLTDVLS